MHSIADIARIRPVSGSTLMDWMTEQGITIRDALREAVALPIEQQPPVIAVLVNSGLIQAPTWTWCLDQIGGRFLEPFENAIEQGLVSPNVESSPGISVIEELFDRQLYGSAETLIRKGFRFSPQFGPLGENIFHRLARDGNTRALKMLLPVEGASRLLRSPNQMNELPSDVAWINDRYEFKDVATRHSTV